MSSCCVQPGKLPENHKIKTPTTGEMVVLYCKGDGLIGFKGILGTSNPYFELWDGEQQLYRSEFRVNSSSPEWKPLLLSKAVMKGKSSVRVRVIDRDTVLKDNLIGEATVECPLIGGRKVNVTNKDGKFGGTWEIKMTADPAEPNVANNHESVWGDKASKKVSKPKVKKTKAAPTPTYVYTDQDSKHPFLTALNPTTAKVQAAVCCAPKAF